METPTENEATTIQVWPSGRMYDYRGDINGPAEQRTLRATGEPASAWRVGTSAEWHELKVSTLAKHYARFVLACDSSLVSDLIAHAYTLPDELGSAFGIDEIRNLYADPSEWDAARCREWLADQGCDTDDTDPDAERDLGYLRGVVRDNASERKAEVMEWWRVDSWLCEQLHAIGEVTIDNGYGCWWGRCTSGQGFIMDGVLQRVADQFVRMEGGE